MNTYKINRFEKWMLRRIFKRIVIQSPEHTNNIQTVHRILREEINSQFTEDNSATLDIFAYECFRTSQDGFKKNNDSSIRRAI